jgi:hypothetical protein
MLYTNRYGYWRNDEPQAATPGINGLNPDGTAHD